MKKPPTLVCGDDGPEVTTNEPEVTTDDPAAADCSCGKDIEKFSKDRFNIKCLGVKEGKKKGKNEETWEFTCPKTGKSKSFTNPKCKKIAKKAKKFCLWFCTTKTPLKIDKKIEKLHYKKQQLYHILLVTKSTKNKQTKMKLVNYIYSGNEFDLQFQYFA